MSTFVLIPGAGGVAWYWHGVAELLRAAGHEAIAVDLPGDDESAGLAEYTRVVVEAVRGRSDDGDVVIVGQSLGGFTAPLVAAQVPTRALVLVNAMIPTPGETPGQWWGATGWSEACLAAAERGGYAVDFDPFVYFLHDVPPEVVAAGEAHQRPEADAVFASVFDVAEWPAAGLHVVVGADDRFFPAAFQRALARDRLGLDVDVLPGGHLLALARPRELVDYLQRV